MPRIKSPKPSSEKPVIKKITNCTFIFEDPKQFQHFWDNYIMKYRNIEVTHNYFIRAEHTWLLKIIKFVLRIK